MHDWMDQALCRNAPVEWFFPKEPAGPSKGRPSKVSVNKQRSVYNNGKRLCKQCPVQAECLLYAYKHKIDTGLWGGLDPSQRDTELTRKRRRKAAHRNQLRIKKNEIKNQKECGLGDDNGCLQSE